MRDFVLAIDQGTTSNTVMVLDRRGKVRARKYAEVRQFYPHPGWVEHDAEQIYRSIVALSRKALAAARVKAGDLAAIGITNQRETFVVWERKSGRPVHRAIVWQCRRSADICERLRDREVEVTRRTGLLIDPYFSGSKLKWLLDADRSLRRRASRGELCFGTIDSWLIFKLSRGDVFVTDFTNASRTMLLNLDSLQWDAAMLEMLGVPDSLLPRPVSSRGPLAETAPGTIGECAVPIGAAIGDQQAALYGHCCVRAGEAKVSYGTGAFLLMHTGTKRIESQNRLLSTAALGPGGEPALALEGAVFIAGAAVQWLRDELGLVARAADTQGLARQSRDRNHPYVVPAFVGLGAPYWDSSARGAVLGITRGTTRADIVRATLDSIAYQVYDVLKAMEKDTRKRLPEIKVDGGASTNNYLMQFQSDLLGRPIIRPKIADTTALGAGMLAGLAVGVWRSPGELAALYRTDRVFKPSMPVRERTNLVAGWHDAVARVVTKRNSRAN
jgi:glycerol kinase